MTDRKMTRAEMVEKADELLAAAFIATQDILDDKTAAATSRASAVSSAIAICRDLKGDGGSSKEHSEMSAEEIADEISRLREQMAT